jgi:pantetheine-phosphate adenylyltransferase
MANSPKAVYAGSFDPFTNGHLYIYSQAAELFGEVVILLASNPVKNRYVEAGAMREMILGAVPNGCVVVWDGLVADFCKNNGIFYLVRGLRNTSDYLYEEEVAKVNAEIFPELKTVYFRAKDDVISSTMVRLLHEQDKNVRKYLPDSVVL